MSTQRGLGEIEDTARDFWANRPFRPRRGRMLAGVAAGIGRRYGVDPVLVRVVLVVSAFYGGAGLLVYLLGWLFLPNEGDQVSAFEAMVGKGRSSVGGAFTVCLCICLIPAAGFVIGGRITQIVGTVMLLAALYLLHRSRSGHIPPPAAAQPTVRTPTANPDGGAVKPSDSTEGNSMNPGASGENDTETTQHLPGHQATQEQPPAWDPLGAAPFAWDLPEPHAPAPEPPPPPPPVPRPRSRVGLVTLGSVLVALGTMAILETQLHGWLTGAHIVGIVTGIVGIGLVAGGMVRGGRWLIVPALILSMASVALTSTGFNGWHGGGEIVFRPDNLAETQSSYFHSVGDMTVDLTRLTGPGSRTISINLNAGDLNVHVPEHADVTATCHSAAGDVNCLGSHGQGVGQSETVSNDGPTGSDLQLTIDATVGTGDLEVLRG